MSLESIDLDEEEAKADASLQYKVEIKPMQADNAEDEIESPSPLKLRHMYTLLRTNSLDAVKPIVEGKEKTNSKPQTATAAFGGKRAKNVMPV